MNGQLYIGEFLNGLKHGKGKWRSNKNVLQCSSYEGEYFNDKREGQGIFTWSSGNTYKGKYMNDERNGFGSMMWTDGSRYEGAWITGI